MYSRGYISGFSRPAASHLAAPPWLRHEGNAGQAPSPHSSLPIRCILEFVTATNLRQDYRGAGCFGPYG
jgi:hypothetical protein